MQVQGDDESVELGSSYQFGVPVRQPARRSFCKGYKVDALKVLFSEGLNDC